MKEKAGISSEKNIHKFDFINSMNPVTAIAGFIQLLFLLSVMFITYSVQLSPSMNYVWPQGCSLFFSAEYTPFIEGAALLAGLVGGLAQFSFLHSKKKNTALMSFGMKRTKLLKNRILSGLLLLFLSVLLFLLLALPLNFKHFGPNVNVLQSFLALLLILTEANVLGFACAALGSILSGRTDEAAVFSVSLAFLPKLLFAVISDILKTCLYGYANLSNIVSYFNPLHNLFFTYSHYNDNLLTTASNQPFYYSTIGTFKGEIIATFIWLLLLLTGCSLMPFLFKRRYAAENFGSRARSRTVNAVIRTAFCGAVIYLSLYFFVFVSVDIERPAYGKWKYVLYASILGGLAAFLADFLLHFNRKRLAKSLISFPICTAIPLLLLCLGFSGFFGFSKRLPNVDTIESAQLIIPFSDVLADGSTDGFDQLNSTSLQNGSSPFCCSSKEDIALTETILQTAISHREKESNSMFEIVYTLKNGHTFSRCYYYISNETERSTLALFKSDAAKKNRRALLIDGKSQSDIDGIDDTDDNIVDSFSQDAMNYDNSAYFNQEDDNTQNTMNFNGQAGVLYLKNHCGKITEIKSKLTKDQYNTLKEALCKDLETITAEEMFTPTEEAVCTLSFSQIDTDGQESVSNAFANGFLFPVYKTMKSTVALLKQDGFENFINENKKYSHICLVNLEDFCTDPSISPEGLQCCRPYFSAATVTVDFAYFSNIEAVTDQAKMALIYKNCFTEYYTRGGGKVAVVTFNDSSDMAYFVPNAVLEKIK